jgi:hypothetical protein
MAPTLLYIKYEDMRLANVKILASFVESLLVLAVPSVSMKKI